MRYFTIKELSASPTAKLKGIENTPTEEAAGNLTELVDNILDPLREAWGRPITVNSGYRCQELNRLVGGVETSMHTQGRAADITAGDTIDNRRLYQLAQRLGLPYFELIGVQYEFRWIHVSYNPERVKRNPS